MPSLNKEGNCVNIPCLIVIPQVGCVGNGHLDGVAWNDGGNTGGYHKQLDQDGLQR